MPVDSKLSSLILSADDCDYVDSFVGMSLSNDGESVEVKYILKRVMSSKIVSRQFKPAQPAFLHLL
jgi:hypothetical protein